MQDFEELFIAKVPQFEDVILWPYLDTHKPPIVTVGTGFALAYAEQAAAINFSINGVKATRDQIVQQYKVVQAMKGGMVAKRYKYPGCLMISLEENARLLEHKVCVEFTPELRHLFKEFDVFPTAVKVALLDMIYTLGLGGLKAYHTLIPAVIAKNWTLAADHCGRNTHEIAYNTRNRWARLQFLNALKG